jgi:hypothetical protein
MSTVPFGDMDMAQLPTAAQARKTNVLVVSSVALAFISFWRAAAIVLCDLASTAYYIGGISEQAIGKAAPWFILGVMLFSYAVRAVYVESCTMFTRGGVYKVVKEAMGGSLAKLSVSALMFDYILTGPISAVAAGQYIVGLFVDTLNLINAHHGKPPIDVSRFQTTINLVTVGIALLTTVYFWRLNIKGVHESSDKALQIMKLTTIMAVIIIIWSAITLFLHHSNLKVPPLHPVFTSSSLDTTKEPSAGWLQNFPKLLGTIGIIIAFGHSLLAMSGEESLAQVNREIEAPKLKNLLRAGFVIFLYSMLLTSLISFLAVLIIPDGKRVQTQIVHNGHETKIEGEDYFKVDYLRKGDKGGEHNGADWGYRLTDDPNNADVPLVSTEKVFLDRAQYHVERDNGGYRDNLISGLCHYLAGPAWIKLIMAAFVVVVGFLILAGAVNTSIVGSNGVLNRLAEDGVLTPNFLKPHTRFGTTYRMINLVAIMQIVTIVASRGDTNTLGEAYAFGVIWSFVFKTLAMCVLRFKDKSPRAYEVPFNIRLKRPGAPLMPAVAIAGTGVGGLGSAGIEHRVTNEPPNMAVPADGEAPKPAINKGTIAAIAHAQNQIDLPIGISIIFLILLSTALINLFTKKTATIWGIGFTTVFLIAFIILEKISHRRHGGHHAHLEQFNEKSSDIITREVLGLQHPNPILVAVRGPRSLPMLERILHETDTNVRDIVVLTCKVIPARLQGITAEEIAVDEEDRDLLTKVVTVTEEVGKQVFPIVLPTTNPLYGIATAARDLQASEVVLGVSSAVQAETQLEQFALAWGTATSEPGSSRPLTVRILGPQVEIKYVME